VSQAALVQDRISKPVNGGNRHKRRHTGNIQGGKRERGYFAPSKSKHTRSRFWHDNFHSLQSVLQKSVAADPDDNIAPGSSIVTTGPR